MCKRFRCGLVVGKFSPMHLGHELLINRARAECNQVIVLSYSKPEFSGCQARVRKDWIEKRFPDVICLVLDDENIRTICIEKGISNPANIPTNNATDHEQRVFVAWVCVNILKIMVDAVFTSEGYGDGFAQVLSKYFSLNMGQSHNVAHICVDPKRKKVLVSGTMIRTDPKKYQAYLSPVVKQSPVKRVCLLGGESTGKTSLAGALAQKFSTSWVAEYGRYRWCEQNGQLVFSDMLQIAQTQLKREQDAIATAQGWLFCDTSPLITLFYSLDIFAKAEPELDHLASHPYDLVLLCKPDFDFVQDGTRRNDEFRQRQHKWYLKQLSRRGIEFYSVGGSLESRLNSVECIMGSI